MSMTHQAYSKIIVDIDGNTYSGRFPKILCLGSVILKISIF